MSLHEPKEYVCPYCDNRLNIIGGDAECPRCGTRMRPTRQSFREEAIQRDFGVLIEEIETFLAER